MNRVLLIPALLIFIAGSACAFSSQASLPAASPTAPAPSASPELTSESTLVVTTPTAPAPPPSAPAAPTTAPAATQAGPVHFTETFDKPDDAWTSLRVITSQATGHDPLIKEALENGRLRVSIQDKETYAYQLFKTQIPGNSLITATFEYRTLVSSGVALICRADPGFSTWYEARLLGAESKVDFYQYDQKLKADGKNPYILLGSQVLTSKEFASASVDTVSLGCITDELRLDLNSGARVITQAVSAGLSGTLAGFGVMSYDLVPVNIDFKTVSVQSQ